MRTKIDKPTQNDAQENIEQDNEKVQFPVGMAVILGILVVLLAICVTLILIFRGM